MKTIAPPDPGIRVQLAREAIEAHRAWDALDTADGWGPVLGAVVGALEGLLQVVEGTDR